MVEGVGDDRTEVPKMLIEEIVARNAQSIYPLVYAPLRDYPSPLEMGPLVWLGRKALVK